MISETDLRHFESGARASDRESGDESEMLVLGAHGKTAEQCYVSAINQTVAKANPEYPASDPVADVAFVRPIESAMGIDFDAESVVQLYEDGDLEERARILSYSFPESRLAPVEEDDAENTDTNGRSFRTRGKENHVSRRGKSTARTVAVRRKVDEHHRRIPPRWWTVPEGACVRYEVCGNVVPGRGRICGPCLDTVRAGDRERWEGESR